MATTSLNSPYTVEGILASLGYPDLLTAASQQARVILLGHLARYQAAIHQYEAKWQCTLEEMKSRYEEPNREDQWVDDDYLEWQWYADAADAVQAQIKLLTQP